MYEFWSSAFSTETSKFIEALNFSDAGKSKPKNKLTLFQDYKEITTKIEDRKSIEKNSKRERRTKGYNQLSAEQKNAVNKRFEDQLTELSRDLDNCYTRSNGIITTMLEDYEFQQSGEPQVVVKNAFESAMDVMSNEESELLVDTLETICSMYLSQFIGENPSLGFLSPTEQYDTFNTKIYSAIFNDDHTPADVEYIVDKIMLIGNSAVKEDLCLEVLSSLNIIKNPKD